MAVFQEDIKYLLAYSSMSQVGYMVLAFALGNHFGWITALYLTLNHFLFKALLFLAVAGLIMRTGTRLMYRMGGLIKRMPVRSFSVLIAIIALSGVPPLSGFGGKWLLYEGLIETGWYLQAGFAFFASGIAFLYLFRLIHSMFLGQLKADHRTVREARRGSSFPQICFSDRGHVVSIFPNTRARADEPRRCRPYFPAEPRLGGLHTHLPAWVTGTRNAIMDVTMGVFIVPLIWLLAVMKAASAG